MNNIVCGGEVQQYYDLSGLSPVDSSSAWDIYARSADDFSAVDFNVKLEPDFLDSTWPSADQDNSQRGSGFAMVQSSGAPPAPRASMRDIMREVKVSEETLQGAVASLGGGAHGLQVLMERVCIWASSEAQVADITATIRKGIVDLSINKPLHHSTTNAHMEWKSYSNLGTTVCDPTHRGSAHTRAHRKSHIVRQRKHPPMSKQQCERPHREQCRNNEARQSWLHLDPELSHGNGKGYEFLFQKELRASDVGSLGRIVLPKRDAERHLPSLVVREGMKISLEDYEVGTIWTVRYRFWPNNKSRMYLLENIGGFVAFHRLQEGDFLKCYRNGQGGYVIRGQKVPTPAKCPNPTDTIAANETTTDVKTIDSKTQFMERDYSTTNTADSSSDSLANSFFDSFSDYSAPTVSFDRQQIRYHNSYKADVLETGTSNPIVELLLDNVKQPFMDGKDTTQS